MKLSDYEKQHIIQNTKEFQKHPSLDFSGINTKRIQKYLYEGPAGEYLPTPNPDYKNELPPLNDRGELIYERAGQKMVVPAKYVQFVYMSFYMFTGSGAYLPPKPMEKVWGYVDSLLGWAFGTKNTLFGQINDTLENPEKSFLDMQLQVRSWRADFQNDDIYKLVVLVPDCFGLLYSLLSDERVSPEFKLLVAKALIYLESPIDCIPEGLINHPIALVDDLGVVAAMIQRGLDGGLVRMKELEDAWTGNEFATVYAEWYQGCTNIIGMPLFNEILDYMEQND